MYHKNSIMVFWRIKCNSESSLFHYNANKSRYMMNAGLYKICRYVYSHSLKLQKEHKETETLSLNKDISKRLVLR